MNLICKNYSRNQIINIFKNLTGDSFDVNEKKIPYYKENYFRLYIDDNEDEFIELFFGQLGELLRFGYSVTYFDSLRNNEFRDSGSYLVLNKIPPAVKKYLEFAAESLEHDAPLHENAQRLYNFISKNI